MEKYFNLNENWYGNSNAMNFIKKFPYLTKLPYKVLGFTENGKIVIFINQDLTHEKETVPYFYVQNINSEHKIKISYKFELMDDKYKNEYDKIKNSIIEFMKLKYKKDGIHDLFEGASVYSFYNLMWQLHQPKNIFSKLFWNSKRLAHYDKNISKIKKKGM